MGRDSRLYTYNSYLVSAIIISGFFSICLDYSNLQKYPIKKGEEVKLPRIIRINQLSYWL